MWNTPDKEQLDRIQRLYKTEHIDIAGKLQI